MIDDLRLTTHGMHAAAGAYVLAGTHPVDDRTSRFPDASGDYATTNAYLLVEPDGALLVDTGLTVHRAGVLQQLRELVPGSARLSILHTRLGEYESICNTVAIVNAFDVEALYGNQIAEQWIDFEAELVPSRRPASHRLASGQELTVAPGRVVDVLLPRLRLLPTFWVYDRRTRTLFTSDLFSYVTQASPDDPPFVTSEDDTTTGASVATHMVKGRFWWLPYVDPRPLRSELLGLFARFDVETIAPGYGRVLRGRQVVQRHVELVADAIVTVGGSGA